MPKITWEAPPDDEAITADDIDNAPEDEYQEYAGDLPPGGVYRFKLRRMKPKTSSTNKQGINLGLNLDGSWKPQHAKYDGCPMWDTIWMTKASAGFAKAFAAALGVTGAALVTGVVTDNDGVITKIGNKKITEGMTFVIAVRRGDYNGEPRIERAGSGYQVVDSAASPAVADEPEDKPAKGKAATGKKGKKSKADDDEPPF